MGKLNRTWKCDCRKRYDSKLITFKITRKRRRCKRYLINNFDTVKTISNPLNSEEESRKLIESKFDVIVQPTIKRDSFVGRADFLIFNKKTGLYEVMDAKLAKQIKSEFLLQVCGYAWMLEEYQDNVSKYGWFFLGDESVEKFKIHEFYRFFLN